MRGGQNRPPKAGSRTPRNQPNQGASCRSRVSEPERIKLKRLFFIGCKNFFLLLHRKG